MAGNMRLILRVRETQEATRWRVICWRARLIGWERGGGEDEAVTSVEPVVKRRTERGQRPEGIEGEMQRRVGRRQCLMHKTAYVGVVVCAKNTAVWDDERATRWSVNVIRRRLASKGHARHQKSETLQGSVPEVKIGRP